jgi:thiamine transport system permease protein
MVSICPLARYSTGTCQSTWRLVSLAEASRVGRLPIGVRHPFQHTCYAIIADSGQSVKEQEDLNLGGAASLIDAQAPAWYNTAREAHDTVKREVSLEETRGRWWQPRIAVLVYLLPLLFLGLFFFFPLAEIFRLSLAPQGELDLSPFRSLFSDPYYGELLAFTTGQALASTLLTLLAGMPAAYAFAHYDFRGKSVLRALTTIPFVLPTMVVAAAFTALLGPQGHLNRALVAISEVLGLQGQIQGPPLQLQQTLALVLIAHVFYNAAIIVRMVGGFWANLDPRVEEAARVLGAGRWRTFREVTLPILVPSIVAASLLVFLFCFTSFGVILVLGGPGLATIEVEIYYQAVPLFNLPMAAALSIAQMAFTYAIMALYTRIQARASVPLNLRPSEATQKRPATLGARLVVWSSVGGLLVFLLAPLLALVDRSFSLEGPYTLRYYEALLTNPTQSFFFVPPAEAIRNSLLVAGATVVLSLIIGLISAYLLTARSVPLKSVLDPLFMLPLGTSAVTLGFGYILALGSPPLNLRTSPLLLPLAHTLVAFPFVVRSLLPALRGMNPHWREAAGVLGASPARVIQEIDLPIVSRALLVGAVFAFTVSMGEFGATLLIARPRFPTMPVVIYRLLGGQGALNQGQGLAMSNLLMLVCAVGFVLIERFRVGEVGEF